MMMGCVLASRLPHIAFRMHAPNISYAMKRGRHAIRERRRQRDAQLRRAADAAAASLRRHFVTLNIRRQDFSSFGRRAYTDVPLAMPPLAHQFCWLITHADRLRRRARHEPAISSAPAVTRASRSAFLRCQLRGAGESTPTPATP